MTAEENGRKQEKNLVFLCNCIGKTTHYRQLIKMCLGKSLCFILNAHICLCCLNIHSYIQFCPVPLNLWRTDKNMCYCICKLKLLSESDFWFKIAAVFELRLEPVPSTVKLRVKLGDSTISVPLFCHWGVFCQGRLLEVARPSFSQCSVQEYSPFCMWGCEAGTQKGKWWGNVLSRAGVGPWITAALTYCQYVHTLCQRSQR